MEVKIGVADSARELVVSSSESPEQVQTQVTEALDNASGLLSLTDDKGRVFVVPAAKIVYVEIGPEDSRRVGFAVGG